jgi:cell shape-determining protein MreD
MNWLAFTVVSWIMLGLEVGFAPTFQIGPSPIVPSFVMMLLAFVALWAPTGHALGAGVALGLCLDLARQVPLAGGEDVVVLGPHALGCLLAAYLVRTMRGMMFRRGALAVGFLSMCATVFAGVVVVACHSLRAAWDPIILAPAGQRLLAVLGSALLTGLGGVLVGWLLAPLRKVMGFPQTGRQAFRMP